MLNGNFHNQIFICTLIIIYLDGYQSIEGNGCDKPPGDEMLNENTRIGVTPDVPVVWCCPACRVRASSL